MASRSLILSTLASSCLFLAGPALADGPLPRPLQVEGVVSYREPYRVERFARYRDMDAVPGTLEGPFIAVDFGPARIGQLVEDEWPDQYATIVGTEGYLEATRHDLVRTCEFPCGPVRQEICHFSALYQSETPIADIGTPLIAIEGRHDLEDFQPVDARPASLESLSPAPGLSSPTWSDGAQYGFRDWSDESRSLTLASDDPQRDGTQWQDCSADDYGELQRLQCGPGNGALLSEGRPVLLSAGRGAVTAFATFSVRGQSYTLVQMGYNAGLLAPTAQGWRGLVRTARRPLTCE